MGVLKAGWQLQAIGQRTIDGDVGDPYQCNRHRGRIASHVPAEQHGHDQDVQGVVGKGTDAWTRQIA